MAKSLLFARANKLSFSFTVHRGKTPKTALYVNGLFIDFFFMDVQLRKSFLFNVSDRSICVRADTSVHIPFLTGVDAFRALGARRIHVTFVIQVITFSWFVILL